MGAPGRGRSAGIVDRLLLAPNWKEADRAGRIGAAVPGSCTLPLPLEHPGKTCQPVVQKEGRKVDVRLRGTAQLPPRRQLRSAPVLSWLELQRLGLSSSVELPVETVAASWLASVECTSGPWVALGGVLGMRSQGWCAPLPAASCA